MPRPVVREHRHLHPFGHGKQVFPAQHRLEIFIAWPCDHLLEAQGLAGGHAHESHGPQGFHRRKSAALLGRALFHIREADDGQWNHRHRRMLWRQFRAQGHDGDDRGHILALCRGHGPVPSRSHVAQGLWLGLHAPPRSLTYGRALRSRDRTLGHQGQGGGQARLRAPRRTCPRKAALLHVHLPESGQGARRVDLLECRAISRAGRALREAWLHWPQV